MSRVVRPYRGVSAQARRADRRERLIAAALDVLGESGIASTTMTAVINRAHLTERYFYESFRGRQELLEAVFDACLTELDTRIEAAVESAPPDVFERSRAAVGALVEVLTDDPRKARMYSESVSDGSLAARRAEAVRAYAGLMAQIMREHGGLEEEGQQAPLHLAALVLVGGVAEAVLGWLGGSVPMSRGELIDECGRLAVAAAEAVRATAP